MKKSISLKIRKLAFFYTSMDTNKGARDVNWNGPILIVSKCSQDFIIKVSAEWVSKMSLTFFLNFILLIWLFYKAMYIFRKLNGINITQVENQSSRTISFCQPNESKTKHCLLKWCFDSIQFSTLKKVNLTTLEQLNWWKRTN